MFEAENCWFGIGLAKDAASVMFNSFAIWANYSDQRADNAPPKV